MKRLFKWLFILLLLAVAIVVGLLLSKDAILKAAVEQQIHAQTVAALAFGESTLRLVAASVAPEHATVAAKLREYAGWAESTDDAAPLTKTEIESVVRYLVGAP